MYDIKRFLRVATLLTLAALPIAATHGVLLAATARAGTFHPRIAVAKPRPLSRVAGAEPLATLRYAIVDRGVPAETKFSLDVRPLAFNNTGQIAGIAYDSVAQRYICELYDGKRFRDLSAAASITNCNVDAIGDASAGSVDVVGYASTVYAVDSKAFYAHAPLGAGGLKTTVFPNDDARLTGINISGTAVGFGDYYPSAGFATHQPPFLATPNLGGLTVLQPGCTLPAPGCGAYGSALYDGEFAGYCPFGGCQITADGTLLLSDVYTGSYETVAPDGSTRDLVLAADLNSLPTINNAKQLLYSIVKIVAGVTEIRPQIYTIGTGDVTTIAAIKGNSCRQYIPLSMNDAGHVLGYTSECPSNDALYFTYDPTHGTQDLTTAIPAAAFSLYPQAINDSDEILVGLVTPDNVTTHWGVLEPIAATAKRTGVAASHWAMLGPAVASVPRPIRPGAARATPRPLDRRTARSVPRPVRLRARTAASGNPQYAIVDYGAPPATKYALEMPVALNNTGQIVGVARDLPYVNSSTCVLFDGTRFRNISASPTITSCTPRSMNDESSAGRLSVVGTTLATYSSQEIGEGDEKAFRATIAPSTGSIQTTLFGSNDMSDLTAINASGLAIGIGDYVTNQYGSDSNQFFFLEPGKQSLQVRPACATAGGACGYLLEIACAFGGCNITADGSLYLYSDVVDPDGSVQPVRFDGERYGSIINDAKQILYYRDVAQTTGPDRIQPAIYQVGTGAVTTVPALAGSSCSAFRPLSLNNLGQVLGVADDCQIATDRTYFIYDPLNGTRDLLAELPAGNASIEPIGINDKGEIAFGLALPSGITHWGLLVPRAPASLRNRRVARPPFHELYP